jgi:RNA polymerase sigma factor (sigma-70 family)
MLARSAPTEDRPSDDRIDPACPSHSRLVTRVASQFRRRLPHGMSWAEFLQEGELALAIARRDFDPERGVKFGTFAWTSILNHLRGFLRGLHAEQAHLPLHPDSLDRSRDLEAEAVADLVWDEVDQLEPFAREAVIRRFGLDGYGEQTQRSTAKSMGCDPRKIHGVVEESLRSMRERLAGDVA